MVKDLLLPLAGVAVFIILVGLFVKQPSSTWTKYFQIPAPAQTLVKTMTVGSKSIQVEIANTESLREKGLSGRSSLDTNNGMLFVFDTKQVVPIFWMKDMQIPLDMIWISGDKIVKIDKKISAPPANTPDNKLDKISAGRPVDYVLEVNSDFCETNGIKVGDSVVLPAL